MNTLHFIHTKHLHIFEQLKIEEAVLRGTDLNLCLINQGSPRAIIMGISGRPELLLNQDLVRRDNIPVIQRFSGGGTVIVDEDTLFISFIFAKTTLPIHPFPEPILRWSGELYQQSWQIPGFHLVENDRSHNQFLCRLKEFARSPEQLVDLLQHELAKRFAIQHTTIPDLTWAPHRESVRWVK